MSQSEIERIAEEAAHRIHRGEMPFNVVKDILQRELSETAEPPGVYEAAKLAGLEDYVPEVTSSDRTSGDEPEQPDSDGLTEDEIEEGYATVYDGFPFSQIFPSHQERVREFANHFYTLGKQSAKAERDNQLAWEKAEKKIAHVEHSVDIGLVLAERDELKAEVEKLESMNMRIEERLTKKRDAMYQTKEIYRKENLDAIAILGSCLSIPTPETGDDVVSGDLVEIAKKAVSRLKSQPIEAKAGPPDLEGVPDDAWYLIDTHEFPASLDDWGRWRVGEDRRDSVWNCVCWHIGPILPPQDPEMLTPAYGYCPHCRAEGISRERRPNGNDTCKNGHVYPSSARVEAARTK